MKTYLELMQDIIDNGDEREDRTGVGTIGLFGRQLRFNLQEGFPLLTTKKTHLRSIIYELLWFLKGETDTKYLKENGVSIWDEWANEHGRLGPIYGHQWRRFGAGIHFNAFGHACGMGGVDQIDDIQRQLRENPNSRRHVVSAWNPVDIPKMALPPCHCLFQFNVRKNEFLDCQLYQRSADYFLGVPFNIASYSLLTMMMAQSVGLKAGHYVHTFGDVHLYKNHLEQVKEQLSREPRSLPEMKINPEVKDIFDFKYEDFELIGYDPHPAIKADVAV